ncbi:transcriptional regulator [Amycolatopsis japonica]|uniref:ArsR/SmtB family transcription factor n=1 Tax=Amycolatopsis japonica TaxID=208439 RepID=UPI00332487CD
MEIHEVAAVLSSEVRVKFLLWLKRPDEHFTSQRDGDLSEHGVCLSLLAEKAEIAMPTALRHLERLKQIGFVKTTRRTPYNFHARDEVAIAEGLKLLERLMR